MIVAATGHRPDKCGGYSPEADIKRLGHALRVLHHLRPSGVISGMALGWDIAIADAALILRIPCHAAVPFTEQESRWNQEARDRYHAVLRNCASVTIICEGGYNPRAMQIRNEWMVDRASVIAALWDGSEGGTAKCIVYARQEQKEIVNTWTEWLACSLWNRT